MSLSVERPRCPVCSTPIRLVLVEYRGRSLTCPECNERLRVEGDVLVAESSRSTTTRWAWERWAVATGGVAVVVFGFSLWNIIPRAVVVREQPAELTVRDPKSEKSAKQPVEPEGQVKPEEWEIVEPSAEPESNKATTDDLAGFDPRFGMPLARPPVRPRTAPADADNRDDDKGDDDKGDDATTPDLAIDRRDGEPISVPMVIWDYEQAPILPRIDGGLQFRAEQRLATPIAKFRTSKPVAVRTVVATLMDLASVIWSVEGKLPEKSISLEVEDSTVQTVLEEVMSQIRFSIHVDEQGHVRLTPVDVLTGGQ